MPNERPPAGAPVWRLRGRSLVLDRPVVVGVLNVTPDSFSDGGRHAELSSAVARAAVLLAEGADAIDVGGESTRPHNAGPVPAEVERARVVPVLAAIRREHPDAVLSVDTTKAEVARAALDAGADVVNDVSGLRLDPTLGAVCAAAGAGVILMHSRGGVGEMATYAHAEYDDVGAALIAESREALGRARVAGIAEGAVVLDPGLGFAKRTVDSVAALRALPRLAALGCPVLVGASRKRFVGELAGVDAPADRDAASVGAHVAALSLGASLFRVHAVRPHREALDVAWRVLRSS